MFAFELSLNGEAVLAAGSDGSVPQCSPPQPACGAAGNVGDVVCNVSLTLDPGDELRPEWASSLPADVGSLSVDLLGRVFCEPGTFFNSTDGAAVELCEACPPGYFCPSDGMVGITEAANACGSATVHCPTGSSSRRLTDVGYYSTAAPRGDSSGRHFAAQAICEPGHFCLDGVKQQCPAGTFGGTEGLSSSECSGTCGPGSAAAAGSASCTACTAGTFAAVAGAGECEPCPAGYFCPPSSSVPQLCGEPGESAAYCPAGSGAPTLIPLGQYGVGDVTNGTGLGYAGASLCDPGYYCPPGDGVRLPCEPGRYGSIGGLISDVCMGQCAPGYWCMEASTSATQFRCGGWQLYCPAGSTSPLDVPVGHYSVGGLDTASGTDMSAKLECEVGYYCSGGRRLRCPPGTFGNQTGLSSDSCTGRCEQGYYCPRGSTSPQERKCGNPRFYCPAGIGSRRSALSGYYTLPEGSANAVQQRICPIAHYCRDGLKAICPAGVYGDVEGLGSERCGGPCLPGYFCGVGTVDPRANECGSARDGRKYCPLGSSAPQLCEEGWYVQPEREIEPLLANRGERVSICPPGFYCTGGIRRSCKSGHVGPESDAPYSVETCAGPCPPGKHADSSELHCVPCTDPTHYCPEAIASPRGVTGAPGHYSLPLNWTREELQLPHSERPPRRYYAQQLCEPGYYCRHGRRHSCQCGRYGENAGENRTTCTAVTPPGRFAPPASQQPTDCGDISVHCPQRLRLSYRWNTELEKFEEFYIVFGACDPTQVTFGWFSACGSADDLTSCDPARRSSQHKCLPGHACQRGELIPCEAGTFNPLAGQERVPSLDPSVWAFNPCVECAAGRYCPTASPEQLLCGAAHYYCPAASQRPTPVSIGFYSVEGPVAERAAQSACLAGSYCVFGLRVPCRGGTWESRMAQTRCAGVCFEGFRCPGGDLKGDPESCTSDKLAPERFYCPAGSVEPRTVPAGAYSLPVVPDGWQPPPEWLLKHKQRRHAAKECEPGNWCAWGRAYPCAAGRFGAEVASSSATCSGKCPTGFVCAASSSLPTATDCGGANMFCPAGTGRKFPVPEGYESVNFAVDDDVVVAHLVEDFDDARTASSRWFATVGGSFTSTCTVRDRAFVFEGGRSETFELTTQAFTLAASTSETELEFEVSFGGDDGSASCSTYPSSQVVVELGVGTPLDTETSWTAAVLTPSEFMPSIWHKVKLPIAPTNSTGEEGVGDLLGTATQMFVRFTVPEAASTALGDAILIDSVRVTSRELTYSTFVGDEADTISTEVSWDGPQAVHFADDLEDINATAGLWDYLSEGLVSAEDIPAGTSLSFSQGSYLAETAPVTLAKHGTLSFDINMGGPLGLILDAREANLFVEWRAADSSTSDALVLGTDAHSSFTSVSDSCPAGMAPVPIRSAAEYDALIEWIGADERLSQFGNSTIFFANLYLMDGQLVRLDERNGWLPTFLQDHLLPAELFNATLSTCSVRDTVEPVPVPLTYARGVTPVTRVDNVTVIDHCTWNTTGVVVCADSDAQQWKSVRTDAVPLGGNGLLRESARTWRRVSLPLPSPEEATNRVVLRMHANVNGAGVVLVDNVKVESPTTRSVARSLSPLRVRAAARPCGSAGWWCARGIAHNATEGYYTVGGSGPETRTAEVLCPSGHYCTRGVKRECPGGSVCAPGSSEPDPGPCAPPPVWCAAGSEEPIVVRPGFYSIRSGGANIGEAPCSDVLSYCKDGLRRKTPPGWYAFGETNMTLAEIEPCGSVAVFCIGGARFVAPPGRYTIGSSTDGLYQYRDDVCGDVMHWCHSGVRHEVAQGYYSVPRAGHEHNRTGELICEAGHFCHSGLRFACPYGTYNEFEGMHYETACLPCPSGTYNNRQGIALQSEACIPCPQYENSTNRARVCWPGVVSVTAVDDAPRQPGLGIGDFLLVQFSKTTNMPYVRFAAVSQICNLSASVGVVDGQWSDAGDSLLIRISDSASADDPALTRVGLLGLSILESGMLKDAEELSQNARTYEPVVIRGSWGPWPAPEIEHLEAFDSGVQQAGVGNGDTLVVRFDMMVMTGPVSSRNDVDALLEFSSPIGAAYSGTWGDDHRTLTVRIDSANGVDQPLAAVGVLFVSVQHNATLLSRDQDSPASVAGALLESGTWGDVPESVLLGVDSKTSIEVVWRPPTTNYGYLVSRYVIQWATNSEFDPLINSTILEVPPGRESYSFIAHDIINGTDYFFRMRAENIDRFGPVKASYPDSIQTGLPEVHAITGGLEMATLGGEEVILVGKNFGREGSTALSAQYTNGNYTFDAASCVVWAGGTQVRCVSAPGVGARHRWRVRVGKFWSPLSPPSAFTSYAAPTVSAFDGPGAAGGVTSGWQLVTVHGTQLGRREDAAVANVQYSTETEDGRAITFAARNCSIVQDHFALECYTSDGAGTALEWKVFVAGQESVAPATRYASPLVVGVNAPGGVLGVKPTALNTQGNEPLNISGTDFGPVDPTIPLKVTYGPSGIEYEAAGCEVAVPHTSIVCYTVEGVGARHRWVVTRLGQSSPPSQATTSYAPPRIHSAEPASGPTEGGWTVRLEGVNFGDGTWLRVMLNGAAFTNYVRDSHTQLTMNIAAGEGMDNEVRMSVGQQSSNSAYFSYNAPRIDSMDILEVEPDGTVKVLILGDSFGFGPSTRVSIAGDPCVDAVIREHAEIECITMAVEGEMIVSVGDRDSVERWYDYFELLTPPVIASIAPEFAPTTGVPTLEIWGTYFKNSGGSVFVTPVRNRAPPGSVDVVGIGNETEVQEQLVPFNATLLEDVLRPRECQLLSHDDERITCEFPPGQGSVMIQVVVRRLESSKVKYEFSPPEISSVSPRDLPTQGGLINITGTNFGIAGNVLLDMDGDIVDCAVESWNHSRVQCVVPAGGVDQIRLRTCVSTKCTDDELLSFLPPRIFNVTPSVIETQGNAPIELTGENFALAGRVLVGAAPCEIVSWNHTRIVCTAPEGEGNLVPIILHTDYQSSGGATPGVGNEADVYIAYGGPILQHVEPTSEAVLVGGWELLIQGSNFGLNPVVFVADTAFRRREANGAVAAAGPGVACPITQRSHTEVRCVAPAGLGSDVHVRVVVAEQLSDHAVFSYAAPVVDSVSPNIFDAHSSIELAVFGRNFGAQLPDAFDVQIDGRPCLDGAAGWRGRDSQIICTSPGNHIVGPINLTVAVQNLTSEVSWITAACVAGYFGKEGELCSGCPEGAVCEGANAVPYPMEGFWRQEPYPYEFLRCQPEAACPGGVTSPCAEGYEGEVCRECSFRWYRVQEQCVPCPDHAWLLILGFVSAVIACGAVAYWLNKKRVNLSGLTVGVDFAQSASVFARFEFAWPPLLLDAFKFISLFTLNIDVVAPSCSIKWSYSLRFYSIQAVPIFVGGCLVVAFIVITAAKALWSRLKGCWHGKAHRLALRGFLTAKQVKERNMERSRKRAERLAAKHLGHKDPREQLDLKMHDVFVGMFLSANYYVYLVVASSALEIFDCSTNANGLVTLDAEPSLTCWEGVHAELWPYASASLIVYGLGIPSLFGWIVWHYRADIRFDQAQRSRGEGDSMANPVIRTRVRFAKLYMDFKPEVYYWRLWLIVRKAMLAAIALMFNQNAMFQVRCVVRAALRCSALQF